MTTLNPFRFFREMKQLRSDAARRGRVEKCLVCGSGASFLDAVDFNKSCEEVRGIVFPPSGVLVDYFLCDHCGFCFSPEFQSWSFEDFERLIYNKDYELVDPEYKSIRPLANAKFLAHLFGANKHEIRHLDYGGGSGLLSETLRQGGWASHTYDPIIDRGMNPEELGSFDLITAFEVFEHVADVTHLFDTLKKLCKPTGLVLFATMLSDGHIARSKKLDWWYGAPRNGHISLFSKNSLSVMATQRDLQYLRLSSDLHAMFTQLPPWAGHIMTMDFGG
jgi:hypothetical protein